MPKHKETWDPDCVEKWEKWYYAYITPEERKAVNKLRARAMTLVTGWKQKEAYLDAIEILHYPLIRKLGIKDPRKAQVDMRHLGEEDYCDKDNCFSGSLGYTIITWKKGD
jgi:phosphopantetheinyl transferase (holo-ACP synthase)